MSYLLTDAVVLGGTRYRLTAHEKRQRLESAGFKVTTVDDFLGLSPEEIAIVDMKLAQLWCETDDCPRLADFTLTCTDPWDGVQGGRHLCGACLDRLEREEREAGAQPDQPAPATGSDAGDATDRWETFPSPGMLAAHDEDGSGAGAAACMTVTFAAVLLLFCVVLLAEAMGGASAASAAAGCLRW